MQKKTTFWILVLAAAITALAQNIATDEQPAKKKLGVFVGKWESDGAVLETPFSRPGKVSSSMECRWSPQGNFLICEQLVKDPTGNHTQLSIYSYNSKDGNYNISSMGSGKPPWNGIVIITGNVWTYPGSFERNGKKVEMRTTNDFSVAGTETFKTELSDDGGAHWVTTLQGTAHKVAP